jgi:hypothetical protein
MHSARRNKRAVIPREVHLQTLPADVVVSLSEKDREIVRKHVRAAPTERRKGGGLEPAAFRFFSSGSPWAKG